VSPAHWAHPGTVGQICTAGALARRIYTVAAPTSWIQKLLAGSSHPLAKTGYLRLDLSPHQPNPLSQCHGETRRGSRSHLSIIVVIDLRHRRWDEGQPWIWEKGERERMKAFHGLLEGEPPCRCWTSKLSEGESPALPDLRGREREPPKGGIAADGTRRPFLPWPPCDEEEILTSCIYSDDGLWRRDL
jgi:hypothetical protein